MLQYGPTHGFTPLVDVLIEMLTKRGIGASHETTLVTTGSQQGLDLVARTLLDPGDVVLLELPSYTGAIAAFRKRERCWSASSSSRMASIWMICRKCCSACVRKGGA